MTKRKNYRRLSNNTWVTCLCEVVNFNQVEGTEYLNYVVENRPDTDSWEALGSKSFDDFDAAYNYAEWLHSKFNTSDLVEIQC